MSAHGRSLEARHSNPIGLLLRTGRILIVDDEAIVREILIHKLSSLGYTCECCRNGVDALNVLASQEFDLLLADVTMPDMGGIALLKEARKTQSDIAVILVASVADIEMAVDSLKDGAYDYITKPFSLEEVSISVSRALEKRRLLIENRNYRLALEEQVASRTEQLKEALEVLDQTYQSTLIALGTALDSRDSDTDGHTLRVTLYTTRLARRLGMRDEDLRVMQQGAVLHDIGKIGVPDELLRRPGPLSENEWVLMRKHPVIGYRILSGVRFLQGAAELVLHHHERYDGNGYPSGLYREDICLGARIFSVADSLDCMTSNRPFRAAVSFEDAREEINRLNGAQFDPRVVEIFLDVAAEEWKIIRADATSAMNRGRFFSRTP